MGRSNEMARCGSVEMTGTWSCEAQREDAGATAWIANVDLLMSQFSRGVITLIRPAT